MKFFNKWQWFRKFDIVIIGLVLIPVAIFYWAHTPSVITSGAWERGSGSDLVIYSFKNGKSVTATGNGFTVNGTYEINSEGVTVLNFGSANLEELPQSIFVEYDFKTHNGKYFNGRSFWGSIKKQYDGSFDDWIRLKTEQVKFKLWRLKISLNTGYF